LVDSLRGLQQASTLDKVCKKFGVGRVAGCPSYAVGDAMNN
jgi:hypothetical protein